MAIALFSFNFTQVSNFKLFSFAVAIYQKIFIIPMSIIFNNILKNIHGQTNRHFHSGRARFWQRHTKRPHPLQFQICPSLGWRSSQSRTEEGRLRKWSIDLKIYRGGKNCSECYNSCSPEAGDGRKWVGRWKISH